MPYTRKTPRRIARHLITLDQLTATNWQVVDEMDQLGLWREELEEVEVYLVSASFVCYGWYQGQIHIPAISGANLSDYFTGHHTRLTDVLRHEWGHALADSCPEWIETKQFKSVFGGRYDSMKKVSHYDPEHHLTPYAAANACEDFAETFHFYLRHKGRLPVRLASKPVTVRKWEFIESMAI